MKLLKISFLSVLLLSVLVPLYSMEVSETDFSYLTTTVQDIQNIAQDLAQDTGDTYPIIAVPALLEKCLQILGLSYQSTPLDIRYHYDLIQKKLLAHDPLLNIFTKAYNQLIAMISLDYSPAVVVDIEKLLGMPFERVQELELEGKVAQYNFLKNKDRLVKHVISALQKEQRKYVLTSLINQAGLPMIMQVVLRLPADSSRAVIEKRYSRYREENSPSKLIALEKMKAISRQELKNKLFEAEKVKEAYGQYLKDK